MVDETVFIHKQFIDRVGQNLLPPIETAERDGAVNSDLLLSLFDSQITSRLLDLNTRALQKQGEAFYTIGSSGHEGTAGIAAATRPTDMAFLHYRDAAFYIQRASQVTGQNPIRDLLLSFVASAEDPISGGRHKVLGSKALSIPPQTSTIASHLPKSVGVAASIGINKSIQHEGLLPNDALVVCSFGDASYNHSTAQGAINSAAWMAYQKMHLPLLMVCEDNGIGISVKTPTGWIENSMRGHVSIKYFSCDGLNIWETYQTALKAVHYIRKNRKPAFLHMHCVRLMGHAGSDVQSSYLSDEEIHAMHLQDPLLYTARLLTSHNILTHAQIIDRYESTLKKIEAESKQVITTPKLTNADEVMRSIIPPRRKPTRTAKPSLCKASVAEQRLPMVRLLNLALHDAMQESPQMILAGEDIGKKGGVYGVTKNLQKAYGSRRVIDTLLDEQSILGLGIGMAHNRLLPIVEIQFLAYLHNAEDQIRGEAATLSFFSNGQYTNPMIVRIAGLAYQKGFGGHFHNDNALAVLRDIPGVIVACPSNGGDAVPMLQECIRLCDEEQRVVVFLEPIALYGTRDLHQENDNEWACSYKEALAKDAIAFGDVAVHGEGQELCILSYGNGYYLSRQAEETLREQHQLMTRVVDIRWLSPLPEAAILRAVQGCKKILIVDECRQSGSISEALMALLVENGVKSEHIARHCATDSFIPLGTAATVTLPSKETVVEQAIALTNKNDLCAFDSLQRA